MAFTLASTEAVGLLLPDFAKDLRINLGSTLSESSLSEAQRFGVAIAAAWASRSPALVKALLADARASGIPETTLDDAQGAAAVMGMNNIAYRFRHLVGKPGYAQKPMKLRMTRIGKAASTKVDLELFSLSSSAVTGCEVCVRSHEEVVTQNGLTEDHVHDTMRIAATIHGVALALAQLA